MIVSTDSMFSRWRAPGLQNGGWGGEGSVQSQLLSPFTLAAEVRLKVVVRSIGWSVSILSLSWSWDLPSYTYRFCAVS